MSNYRKVPTTVQTLILLVLAILGCWWVSGGLTSPLWVDELHTSWTVSGSWSELFERSKAGNQSFVYFAALKLWTTLVGQSVWSLRLPSLVAWIVSLISVTVWLFRANFNSEFQGAQQVDNTEKANASAKRLLWWLVPAHLWCLCVFLDRWQYFYAVEARPYSIVQLLNLWSWMLLVGIWQSGCNSSTQSAQGWRWLAWATCAVLMVDLHITSGLSLVCQAIVIVILASLKRNISIACLTSLVVVGSNAVWQLVEHNAVWNRRQQWATFAGDDSLSVLLGFFPFKAIVIPVGLCLIGAIVYRKLARAEIKHSTLRWSVLGWLFAGTIPILLAWMLTHQNIAPLMHYRFVITAALPLYLLFGEVALALNMQLRWIAVSSVLGCLVLGQTEGIESWSYDRSENWARASESIARQIDPSRQSLWCYAGLIEGKSAGIPLTEKTDEYLSYPMRGLYQVRVAQRSVDPHGLIADRGAWLKQFQHQIQADGRSQIWIIYRGPADRLEGDLKSAGLDRLGRVTPIESYDRVCTVCLDLSGSHGQ